MAFDRIWGISVDQKSLFHVQLDPASLDHGKIQTSVYIGESRPEFSASLTFDGVCINYLYNEEFFRISALTGEHLGKKLNNPHFGKTQKAAPLVVEFQNPDNKYQPYRYWVGCLKSHLLVVDIRFAGDEAYFLIPWPLDPGDEARSPVAYKGMVYFLTKRGRLFCFSLDQVFQGKNLDETEIQEIKISGDFYCFAPMIVNQFLVFQTIATRPHKPGDSDGWHETGYFSFNLEAKEYLHCASGEYAKLSDLENLGHLSGFSDGRHAIFPSQPREKHQYVKFFPGQNPQPFVLSWRNDRTKPPVFSCSNAVIHGNCLVVIDQNRKRVLRWNLSNRSALPDISALPVQQKGNSSGIRLASQPMVAGNTLILVLADQIITTAIK